MMNRLLKAVFVTLLAFFVAGQAFGQFSGTISGFLTDPTGAVIPNGTIKLHNQATGEDRQTQSGASGNYQFVSLAPGSYIVTGAASGFSGAQSTVTLETNQTLNLPLLLPIGASNEVVNITAQAPVLDHDDTRLEETLSTETLSKLPLAGRNMISLVTLAPGVTGTGVTSNGSPGSGRDNFSTETQVDASANGQGAVGNMYIIDGLDVGSSIRPGVLNMTPNPDTIQEATIQTNTYNVDYGRASSIQMTMTTKSGGNRYHGNVSDYFTYQGFFAGNEFSHNLGQFHTNNISATVGGPILPHHNFGFFFFGIEPVPSSNSVSAPIVYEDPAFTAFAQKTFPNSIGTSLLVKYPVSKISNAVVSSTAAQVFPMTCGTSASGNLPCSTPVFDTANYTDTATRNGLQYNIRLDKDFTRDRVYGTFYKTTLSYNSPNPRAAFLTTSNNTQFALQGSETHTFSPNTINEASFAVIRVDGVLNGTGLFSVPSISVTGLGQGIGTGFSQGDFLQHNYHWRDVLTHTFHSHDVRLGYEGLFADDIEIFNGPYDQPSFFFNSLLDLVQDNPFTESNLSYNPTTGLRTEYSWDAAGVTHGAFVEDTWKTTKNLTLTYGLRYDDFGNPYQRTPSTVFGNFIPGPGTTTQQQIANGFIVASHHALNRSITDIFSPRGGFAYNPTKDSKWLIKGGAGFFHNWPTLANLQEEFRGNPPGNIFPTFYAGTATPPIFGLGTSNNKPFGYTAPTLPARPLDSKGGISGLQFNIGGVDANLKSPLTYTYSATVERELTHQIVASVNYSGARGKYLLSGGGQVYNVSYGQDINRFNGDLIQNNSQIPTRLNTSFGAVYYTKNDRQSGYNAFITSVRGQFSKTFFNASYTRSASKDDSQVLPTYINPSRYYGPSNWDAPNRFSFVGNHQLPDLGGGNGLLGRVLSGYSLNGTIILQSGNPFNVYTSATFANGGDYNADGDNYDFPDVVSYGQNKGRQDFLKNGTVVASGFSKPTPGTDGNELFNSFRGPGFAQVDASLLKDTTLRESVKLQLRLELFNVFNRPNLGGVVSDLSSGLFGKATSQGPARFFQIGGNLTF